MTDMNRQIFVNLPVKDLDKSIEFFTRLGFTFDQKFTDKNATCMIIGKNIFAMLIVRKFFNTFIPGKKIADASKNTEVLVALSAKDKKDVDKMISDAIKAGGSEYREASDYGWMYSRSFQDPDSHIWEIMYMDESKIPKEMKDKEVKK